MLTMKPNLPHPNLTVQPPPWDLFLDDPTAEDADDLDIPVDAFSCDEFRMYEFKVRSCARARSHDWTECPFAHPGEKARRRDPRKHRYSGATCPDYRKGTCAKGDTCEYAHGVFECWLHPSRYRTQPCKDGTHCRRRVCFFAHTPDQIRVLPGTDSPGRVGLDSASTLSESPPMSPLGVNSVGELSASLRQMKMSMSPPGWGVGHYFPHSPIPGFLSLPSTPTKAVTRPGPGPRLGNGVFDLWENSLEEEPVMERVESGRELRARIYAKLSKENSLDQIDPVGNGPDMSWISELVN